MKKRGNMVARPSLRPRRHSSRLSVERLEDRTLPTSGLFIQGTAFLDANRNGILDPGEPPVQGATMELFKAPDFVTPIASTLTDLNGYFLFQNLESSGFGNYRVKETPPPLSGLVTDGVQTNLWKMGQATQVNDSTAQVPLTDDILTMTDMGGNHFLDARLFLDNPRAALPGGGFSPDGYFKSDSGDFHVQVTGPDFGTVQFPTYCVDLSRLFTTPVSLQLSPTPPPTVLLTHMGRVGYLYNQYGIKDFNTGDPDLDNIKATALQIAIWELLYDQVINLDFGNFFYRSIYPFPDWSPDPLSQAVRDQANAYLTESLGQDEPVAFLKNLPGTPGDLGQTVLVSGTLNFVNVEASSLSGFTYKDFKDNGVFDPDDKPLSNITVTLTGHDNLGQPVNLVTTTDGNGLYLFPNLRPGTYTITEIQSPQYLPGKTTQGTPGTGTVGQNVIKDITLEADYAGQNNNFANLPIAGSISGSVYVDANGNGVRDPGEAGVPGATMVLQGTNNLGEPVLASAVTDANGNYTFVKMRPGTYQIQMYLPAYFLDGKDTAGNLGGVVANDLIFNIPMGTNQVGVNYLFGIRGLAPWIVSKREFLASTPSPGSPGSIILPAGSGVGVVDKNAGDPSGFVYIDQNGNGLRDPGESGIGGVRIDLIGTTTAGNLVFLTRFTGPDGYYQFGDLASGIYSLVQTQPANYLDGEESVGTLGGIAGNHRFTQIVLPEGMDGTDYNFGEILASIRPSMGEGLTSSSLAPSLDVNQVFNYLLGRAPDQTTLVYWQQQLQSGSLSFPSFVSEVLATDEYFIRQGGTAAGFLTGLYVDLLGRTPRAQEILDGTSALVSGLTRGQVAATLFSSPEALSRPNTWVSRLYGEAGQYVNRFYFDPVAPNTQAAEAFAWAGKTVNPGPTPEQISRALALATGARSRVLEGFFQTNQGQSLDLPQVMNWLAQRNQGSPVGEALTQVLNSADYFQKHTPGEATWVEQIQSLYQGILDRAPLPAEMSTWVDEGASISDVVDALLSSPEFQDLLLASGYDGWLSSQAGLPNDLPGFALEEGIGA